MRQAADSLDSPSQLQAPSSEDSKVYEGTSAVVLACAETADGAGGLASSLKYRAE